MATTDMRKFALFLVMSLVLVTGCSARTGEKQEKTHQIAAEESPVDDTIGLETVAVDRRELQVTRALPGKIEPDVGKEVDISSRVHGRVDQVLVSPGQAVNKGQVLAILTSREISELQARVARAESSLQTARAQEERESTVFQGQVKHPQALIDARATLREANAQLHLMKMQLDRQQTLFKEKIAAQKDLAAAQADYEKAESNVHQARASVEREETFFKNRALLRAPLQKAEAERRQAEKELEVLHSQLHFLGSDSKSETGEMSGVVKITAPIDGVLSFFDVAVGELVQADHAIFRLSNLSTVLVTADVPEVDIGHARQGSTIHVHTPILPQPVSAKITIVGNHVDPATRTLPVRARIENKGNHLKPGMFVEVNLVETKKTALAVPKDAVHTLNGQSVVFVKTKHGFVQREVTTGANDDNNVEIVSGLSEGEVVAARGSLLIKTELSYQKKQP